MIRSKDEALRVLLLIGTPKLTKKAAALCEAEQVPVLHSFRARGTATKEIADMLGVGSVEKEILLGVLPGPKAGPLVRQMGKQLHLGFPNTGVAFTIALTGVSSRLYNLVNAKNAGEEDSSGETVAPMGVLKETPMGRSAERKVGNMTESRYSLIMVIVNQGYSEEVMSAARPRGATGGTVFHSRRVGVEEAMKFWGISVQQEREILLVLVDKAKKRDILQAINEKCGMQSAAHGVVMSLPVEDVAGMD